jgi:hypothetical protein
MDAIITISDTHVGSLSGLCSTWGIRQDNGARFSPSKFQDYTWNAFTHFWREYVPAVTKGARKIAVVINGDLVDGNHHNAVDIIPNIASQEEAAVEMFGPIAKIYQIVVIRGTEAHGGISEQSTERVARELHAVKDESTGNSSWWQYWVEAGDHLFQFAHHIGTTGSTAYETTALTRELTAGMSEATQWGTRMPDTMVRSHRHRFSQVILPSARGRIQLVVTPGWQLRTPFVERIDRIRLPHIGGVVFLCEDGQCQVKEKMYPLPQPKVNRL